MRAPPVEVPDVLVEDTPQLSLVHDHDVIQAFAPHAAQKSLTDCVRTRCLDRRSQHLNPTSVRDGGDVWTIRRIVIANQGRGRFTTRRGLPQLLGDPFVCWGSRYADLSNAPRMRSAPHNRFVVAISLIRVIVSAGIFGSWDIARDFRFQNR